MMQAMATVYWCRGCGRETTGSSGVCPYCGMELTLSPLPELVPSDEPEVGFELVDWSPAERADLVAWLIASRIRHRMGDESVTVGAADEARTDGIIDWVTSPARRPDDAIPAEELSDALVALRRACRSIERDPGLVVSADLIATVQEILEIGVPEGWPIEAWYEVRMLTDRLVNEAGDASDATLLHWARRIAWLIRVYSGRGPDGIPATARVVLPPVPGPAPSTLTGPKVSWCPECLHEDVTGSRNCLNCGAALVASQVAYLPEADHDDDTVQEVEYRLDGWDDDQRRRLLTLLFDYRVAHRFEDGGLIVRAVDEELVDTLTSDAATGVGPAAARTTGRADPEAAEPLSQLLEGARVVVRTPSAVDDPAFVDAALAVLTMPAPFGIDHDQWDDAGELTHELVHGSPGRGQAEVANRAASLARLIATWLSADELPIVPKAESADAADELVYELPQWSDEQRRQLALVFDREGITYSWEGENDLIVDAGAESRVDTLLDEVETADDPPEAAAGGQDEAGYQSISELFGACDRLFHRPADKDLRREASTDAAHVRALSAPYGVVDSDWWQITSRAGMLADALDMDAEDDVIADHAATLRDLLRAFL